ncbi:uncharacterized protein LOC127462545 [Manacus candei]|uniref:uncharacterized protein LOC127462545 n=1 Tax=Manacus candei TaxID=415023 RepID=UPI002226F54B|nr:uncharacterized protein LOC127462545 [Manacus candei]
MIISLHEDQHGQVRYGNALSEPFLITNGVKQGCILTPTLLTIFFSMMLQRATADLEDQDGIYIQHRTDGSLFNLRRLKAHTKTLNHLVRELLYADDTTLVTHTEAALQRLTSCFADAAELFGLEVSLKKTEVLHQPAPQEVFLHPHITIGKSELKSVQQFNYLGSLISSDGKIDGEIDNRLTKAYNTFRKLHKRVWRNKHLKKSTKISVYRAIVLSTLLYRSESWVIYHHHLRLLERFHQRCLHTILNIHWSDYVTNTSVLEQAAITSIEAMLLRTQLRWAGHISRMKDHCLPKILLYGELATGCRKKGAPKRRYKDSLKQHLSLGHIGQHNWSTLASNREAWRHTIYNAAVSFENTHRITSA